MGERDARERFARAVDSVDGESTDSGDREFGAELAVVRDLQRAGTVPVSDQRTRDNVALRIKSKIDEPAGTENRGVGEPAPARLRRRLRPALAAAFCLLAGLCGLALQASEDALPGEPLYSVKRAKESAVLALTFDKQELAQQRLAYAADRVDELARLAARDGAELAAAYAAGLAAFDDSVRAASVALTGMAAGTNGEQLRTLRTWSAQQAGELTALAPALPPAAARRQASSVALLERVGHRAAALRERFDCYQITSGVTDELGVVPATGPCVPPAQQARERIAPSPAPAPPPVTSRPLPDTVATNPVSQRPAAPLTSERRAAREPATVPGVTTTTRAPAQVEPVPPVPTPPPADRPRVPSDAGDTPSTADEPVRDMVGDVLDTPAG